jgi:hypothetical protein
MRDGYLDIPLSCEVYTPIGRILERLQIVELPQLLNVLIDGMSLVGNRPLPKENLELLAQFPAWEKRFESPGGITGIAQIVGKLNLTPATRLRLESLYSKVYQEGNITRCDSLIIWHTMVGVLLRDEGISLNRAEALLQSCLPQRVRVTRAAVVPQLLHDPRDEDGLVEPIRLREVDEAADHDVERPRFRGSAG